MIGRIGGRWNRALSVVVGLAIAVPFYWLLIDTTSTPELIAGAVAAVIAAATYSAAHMGSENAAIRPRLLVPALRETAKVPMGILIVCVEVLAQTVAPRSQRGVLEAEHFESGSGDHYDLGRRALAEALRSFAPNTIVIGVDPDSDRLLQHRVGPKR